MAQYILEARAQARGLAALSLSMSMIGLDGAPAAPSAIQVCRDIGIDLEDHRAQPINRALLRAATHVLVMEPIHEQAALDSGVPASRIHYLGGFDPEDPSPVIADPHQRAMEDFIHCRDRILRAVDGFLDAALAR